VTDGAAALPHLRAADAALARLIDAVGPCRLEVEATASLFGALAEAIVYQQLTTRVAATIFGRVRGLFPGAMDPAAVLAMPEDDLRGAGLSRAKTLALRDLAARTAADELPTLDEARALDDEALVSALTRVRGIGRWTAQMLLIFNLGRPDVLPSADYELRKGFARTYGLAEPPPPRAIEADGERWRPFRTTASWYLWRALEQ
jgi:3-methyladenine DNA glycosylase/8-oxoguanine DNA glycosylase